ncbi:MAG: glycosyltransferase family 2 protein, partial [Pseudonocardiaceae bacterium]
RALIEVLGDAAAARMGGAARAAAERKLDVRAMRTRYAELLAGLGGAPPTPAAARRPPGAGLAVVTVLHDSAEDLVRLLTSLERHLPDVRVVVVDSGSSDAGAELARSWRGGAAEVLVLGENTGFGRAANAGLSLVDQPVTALLNPDVELPDASLAAAADEALRAPERLLAPQVVRPDGTREDNAQREPGHPALLAHALLPGAALPGRLASAIEPWRSTRPRRAGWPVGSCIVARTETLRRLGPFDERVFMYAEDLDLGLRATDAGVETWFWPAARVMHVGAHSTRRAYGGEPFELLARRRREVVRERRGARGARADDVLQLLTFADRLLLKRLTGGDSERERRQ